MSEEKHAAEVRIQRGEPGESIQGVVKRNVAALRAAVFGLDRVRKVRHARAEVPASPGASSGESWANEDPVTKLERTGQVVPPPFDLLFLAVMPENNTEIGPCIDAMAVNVESFGWRLQPRVALDEGTSPGILRTLAEEQVRAENFFSACAEDSLEELRDRLRRDLEATGNCYVEFLEVPGTGELDGLNHLPSWTMRIGRLDEEATEYVDLRVRKRVNLTEVPPAGDEGDLRRTPVGDGEVDLRKGFREEVSYELEEQIRWRRFRRYVQVRDRSLLWFKELGDPRLISAADGHVVTREELTREDRGAEETVRFTLLGNRLVLRRGTVGFPVRDAANPVRHRRIYSTRSPYGLPRYVGHLFCLMGSRASEEINFTTFKNNNVPSMAITVTNGKLDDDSVERIQEFVEAAIQGDDNYSKFLLLEAEPVLEGMRDPGSMKIEIKPLTREQHTDELFSNYRESNDERVRRAWRFPPVFVGKSDDFTGKTIDPARRLGDEQVFGPERQRVDAFFSRDVLLRLGIVWSTFKSNGPNVTENADLVRLIASGEKTGGVTPRIARQLLSRVVNEDLGDVSADGLNPDQPFSLTLAQIMKSDSNTAAPGGGEETSQGRAGLQVGGTGERDRTLEPAGGESLTRLAEMLQTEAARRFGGFVPPALDPED